MSTAPEFDESAILSYLDLPAQYDPSPTEFPIEFLIKHLHHLPPHLTSKFSLVTNPKQRTSIPTVRNRRLKYTDLNPNELNFASAKSRWPTLWEGRERRGQDEGREEKEWAETEFLTGERKHVGKLGNLLRDYEEEREAERVRSLRRDRRAEAAFVPEEDSDSEEEEIAGNIVEEEEPIEQAKASFERLPVDYDSVDFDERLDNYDDREAEERWFDEEDEEIS